MKKMLWVAAAAVVLTMGTSEARVYKGQKEYVKKCRKCHGGGQDMANSRTMREWETVMKNKGKELASYHIGKLKAKKSWDYFESSRFTKKANHIEDFLIEYAKDSGNVPACN